MQMNDWGKLIVSTKAAAAGRKITLLVGSAIMILSGIFGLLNQEIFAKVFAQAFGRGSTGKLLVYGVCFFVMGYGVYLLISSFWGFKSYCDVYENIVVGTSGLSASKNAAPQQNFELSYEDIVNVSESGKTIFIYTTYGNFEVLALKNRVEATREIRKRMKGKTGEEVK